jgi:hypothetical protein
MTCLAVVQFLREVGQPPVFAHPVTLHLQAAYCSVFSMDVSAHASWFHDRLQALDVQYSKREQEVNQHLLL